LFYLKAIISPSCHHEQLAAAVSVCVANVYEHCRGLRPIHTYEERQQPLFQCPGRQSPEQPEEREREREREREGRRNNEKLLPEACMGLMAEQRYR
jgi:hypothetical protein